MRCGSNPSASSFRACSMLANRSNARRAWGVQKSCSILRAGPTSNAFTIRANDSSTLLTCAICLLIGRPVSSAPKLEHLASGLWRPLPRAAGLLALSPFGCVGKGHKGAAGHAACADDAARQPGSICCGMDARGRPQSTSQGDGSLCQIEDGYRRTQRVGKRRSIGSADADLHSGRDVSHGLDYIELLVADREPGCFKERQPMPLFVMGEPAFAVGLFRSSLAFRVQCRSGAERCI